MTQSVPSTNRQRPSGMPIHKYSAFPPDRPARPHLARPHHHRRAAVVQRRPARRQPGPDRPDDARPASGGCSICWSRWATRRSRSASRPPARPTSTSSARSSRTTWSPTTSPIQVLTQAREELIERTMRVAGRLPRHRADPPLQLDLHPAAPGRLRPRRDGIKDDRRPRRRVVREVRRAVPRHGPTCAGSTARSPSPAPNSTTPSRSARR